MNLSSAQLPPGMRERDNALTMTDSPAPVPHTHRVTLLIAVSGVLVSGYTLWRADKLADRQDTANDRVQQLDIANTTLRAELKATLEREAQARSALEKEFAQVAALPQQVKDLTASHEDLRARTERPQRAWSRAEALYLIELAQRRLNFDHDTATAIVALEAADARLAALRDASLQTVRERLAADIQALRAVPEVDRVGVMARIAAIDAQTMQLPLKGVLAGQRVREIHLDDSASFVRRAASYLRQAMQSMFVVRRLSDDANRVVSLEEQSVRRQHLALLALDARHAVLRNDSVAYRAALQSMQSWLAQHFDESPALDAASVQLAELLGIDIAPPLPSIAGAAQLLGKSSSSIDSP